MKKDKLQKLQTLMENSYSSIKSGLIDANNEFVAYITGIKISSEKNLVQTSLIKIQHLSTLKKAKIECNSSTIIFMQFHPEPWFDRI